jgi:hypothetical protein
MWEKTKHKKLKELKEKSQKDPLSINNKKA